MSLVTPQIESYVKTQSWIRRMFEVATELIAQYGTDSVFDFSLGNPDVPPPAKVGTILKDISHNASKALSFGYCPNAGLTELRTALATKVKHEQMVEITSKRIVVTSGAAGAMNIFLRSVICVDEEVVCFAPYFAEYGFYVGNYGGVLKPVMSKQDTFEPDINALENAITSRTRALIINSPNNPSGKVYTQKELEAICTVLRKKSKEYNKPIFLISDEPYRSLVYDNIVVPPILPLYEYSVVISSFSKSLSLAGERIGFIAVNPIMPDVDMLCDGLILSNRILGYVNAPIIGQLIVLGALECNVNVDIYDERRMAMATLLEQLGINFKMPQGAFYFFPKVPYDCDEFVFIDQLVKENILAVPGSGFGYPGYFRVNFCVDKAIIERSAEAWARAIHAIKSS